MKIPTSRELFDKYACTSWLEPDGFIVSVDKESFEKALLEFAKLHVQAALKAADDNADVTVIDVDMTGAIWGVDSETILNAYPLENIK
jgi:hypothetical protein